MAQTPRDGPFSVPDPLAEAWDEMVRKNRLLQATNDPFAPSGLGRAQPPMGLETALRTADMPNDEWQRLRRAQLSEMDNLVMRDARRPPFRLEPLRVARPSNPLTQTVNLAPQPRAGQAVSFIPRAMSERQWETEAGQVVGDAARAGGAAMHRQIFGSDPEAPRSDNPVARWAESHVGGAGYRRYNSAPDARGQVQDHLPPSMRGVGSPKCNQFVWDALTAGGVQPGRMEKGRIPVADDWGDPKSKIAGFAVVDGPPQPGDVVSDGHHVGIYSPLPDGRPGTVSAASPFTDDGGMTGAVVHNDWGFRNGQTRTVWRATRQ
jgi:hypothetical protein